MKQISRAIPSNFIPLDSAVTDPDRFVNVRDMQVLRQNHNILLARSLVRTPLVADMCDGTATGYVEFVNREFPGIDNTQASAPIFKSRIALSQHIQTLDVELYCKLNRGTANVFCWVYPVVSLPRSQRAIDDNVKIVCNNTSWSWESATNVPVPPNEVVWQGKRYYTLTLYLTLSQISGTSALGSPSAISAVTSTSVTIVTPGASVYVGDVIYFDDLTIEARVVTATSVSGGNTTYTVGKPWGTNAPTTANTCNFYYGEILQLQQVRVHENRVTDFDAVPELI